MPMTGVGGDYLAKAEEGRRTGRTEYTFMASQCPLIQEPR
jgi:hypothetical protein